MLKLDGKPNIDAKQAQILKIPSIYAMCVTINKLCTIKSAMAEGIRIREKYYGKGERTIRQ